MNNKGFTLVELMVVVLIVGILAAVAVPLMMGRINDAKWTEGKTAAGTIATNIKAYFAAEQGAGSEGDDAPTLDELNIDASELDGKYFSSDDYSWTTDWSDDGVLTYTITVSAPADGSISSPASIELDEGGEWTENDT